MENEKKSILRKLWNKTGFEWKMWRLDSKWRRDDRNRWKLFPPSFFYRHAPEEAERIVEETMAYFENVIRQYAAEENTTDTP